MGTTSDCLVRHDDGARGMRATRAIILPKICHLMSGTVADGPDFAARLRLGLRAGRPGPAFASRLRGRARGGGDMLRTESQTAAQQGFRDRHHAGRVLATKLSDYAGRADVLVFGLPRGGVPVAYEVARALRAPLDVFIVRKLGVPGHEELAMGAIASGGVRVLNDRVVRMLNIPGAVIDRVAEREERELRRREGEYRGDRPPPQIQGRRVILIDDGLATGATMRAAVAALRQQKPAELVVAVPVAAAETCEEFQSEADRVVCASTPEPFHAVGVWYENFEQTSDEEVHELLDRARGRAGLAD